MEIVTKKISFKEGCNMIEFEGGAGNHFVLEVWVEGGKIGRAYDTRSGEWCYPYIASKLGGYDNVYLEMDANRNNLKKITFR